MSDRSQLQIAELAIQQTRKRVHAALAGPRGRDATQIIAKHARALVSVAGHREAMSRWLDAAALRR